MGNPLTSSQFIRLLTQELTDVRNDTYKELHSMIPMIYNEINSNKAWEEYLSVGAVPDIPEFTGQISYLDISPGYHMKVEPKEYAAGLQFERKLLDDEQYGIFRNRTAGLIKASHRVKEKLGVKTFANAFSTAYDFMESEEGTALCSSSHTTKSGTSTANGFDNAGTSALNKTAVAATRILMRQYRNDISERIEISDNLALIVPDNLADAAEEIVGTPKSLDTAEGNINMQYKRYKVIPYLRLDDYDTNNWFMVDMDAMKRDLIWINRIKDDVRSTVDFENYAVKVSIYLRVAYGWRDWRWIYGHSVS